ncbi:MAG: RDD family protein [Clostridia bacterium]|nr:RDD family protein [Clostridia bacterium]
MQNIISTPKASIIRRFAAFYIDILITSFIATLVAFLAMGSKFDSTNANTLFQSIFICILLGIILFICKDIYKGISIGRWLFRIVVRKADDHSKAPSIHRLVIRNLLMLVWPIEFLTLLVSGQERRIGDNLANTDVIVASTKRSIMKKLSVIALTLVLALSLFIGLIVQLIKSSDAYKTSITYIEQSPYVQSATNGIEGYGWLPMGSISIVNNYGEANFTIKVKGKTKDIRILIYLVKKPDEPWTVQNFDINLYN